MGLILNNYKTLNGYIIIYKPNHRKSFKTKNYKGFVYEHVYIADTMCRELREDEVVHHMDGNKLNNNTNNLLILTNDQHTKLHNFIKNKNKEKKSNNKRCLLCGLHLQYKQNKFCSKECYLKDKNIKSKIPKKEQLIDDFKDLRSFVQVGNKYGVSDNTVRKWCKKLGLPLKPKEIKKIKL